MSKQIIYNHRRRTLQLLSCGVQEKEFGIGEDQVDFSLGWKLSDVGIPSPIEMIWNDVLSDNEEYYDKSQRGCVPRSNCGIRRKCVYDACDPPLFHKALVDAIIECDVENFEAFKVRITDTKTNEICDDYLAVNFIGLVNKSNMNEIQKKKMFRLAEHVNALVVHQSVKDHLESKGGFELDFTKPKEWIG